MRKSTAINLELIKGEDTGVKFYAKQFDDLKIKAKIFNGLEEVNILGQDITVCIMKEDKTVIEQRDDISIEENTIVINLSKQATTALGKCTMEILLSDEEGTASTSTVSYLVSEKLSASIVEIIKSADDINALNIIEEFVKTSNVDILDIKGAITELRDTVNNAQGSINTELESIIGTLRALEGTIIDNINVKGNEAINTANSAVAKANEAVTKTDGVLAQIEEAKLDAIGAVSERGTNVGQDLTTMATTLKGEITATGTLETNKVIEANTGALSSIEVAKTDAISSLGTEAIKVEGALNVTVSEIKKQAETDLNACKTDLDAYILLAKEQGKTDLNGIKDGVILEVNNLKGEVDNVLISITEKVTESNSNIEELTALIEEAKIVAGLVRTFIEENSATVDLSNYYTKAEVEAKIDEKIALIDVSNGGGFIDAISSGLYLAPEPAEYATAPTPDFDPVHTFKFKAPNYQVIYFKVPLVDSDKFINTSTGDETGDFVFNGITISDYTRYVYSGGSWIANQTIQRNGPHTKTTRVYSHDFPIYGSTKDAILFEDTTKTGIADFDKAVIEGNYSINLSETSFNNLYNGVKVEGNKQVVGELSVKKIGVNVVQIMDLASHGLSYMRTIGNEWIDTSNGAISKGAIGKIKVGGKGLPDEIKNIPPFPLYGQKEEGLLIFRENVFRYHIIRFLKGWTGRVYFDGSYIGITSRTVDTYKMTYATNTGSWTIDDNSTSTSAFGTLSVSTSVFEIYHNTMPIYKSSSTANTNLYQDVTLINEGETTLTDVNGATSTGIYEIDVKTGDEILNLPIATQEVLEETSQETYSIASEDFKGLLQVYELGNDIYQEITSTDNINSWKRTRVNGVWSDWRRVITEAMFLSAFNMK